jgi:hypothetical protein
MPHINAQESHNQPQAASYVLAYSGVATGRFGGALPPVTFVAHHSRHRDTFMLLKLYAINLFI